MPKILSTLNCCMFLVLTHFVSIDLKKFTKSPFNPIRSGPLGGIKFRGGGTKNRTFENPLLIFKML